MTPLERAARALTRLTCPPGGEAQFPYVSAAEWEEKNWRHHVDAARAVLEAIREPSEEFAATLACALADTNSPDGYAEVSGADQEHGAKMAEWMRERGFTMVKYPRDMIDDGLAEGV